MPMSYSSMIARRDMERVFGPLSKLPRPAPSAQTRPDPQKGYFRRALKILLWALLAALSCAVGLTAIAVVRPIPLISDRLPLSIRYPASLPISGLQMTQNGAPQLSRRSQAPVLISQRDEEQQYAAKASHSPAAPKHIEKNRSRVAEPTPEPKTRLCPDARDRDECFYREVEGADQRLRQAYDNAVKASLPTSDLAEIRRAWVTALSRSRQDPSASILSLDNLTKRLYGKLDEAPSNVILGHSGK
jgi:uncharacterized protein YecT (DUF1311 family)